MTLFAVDRARSGRLLRALPLVVVVAGLTACASVLPTPAAEDPSVRELQRRVVELQQRAAVSDVQLAELRAKVAVLEAQLAGRAVSGSSVRPTGTLPAPSAPRVAATAPAAVAPPSSPAPVVRPDPVTSRPSVTPGATSTPAARSAAPPTAASPASAAAPSAPPPPAAEAQLEESDLPEPAPTPAVAPVAPPASTAPAGGAVSLAAQALYDQGYTLHHQGRYAEAEAAFRQFLERHASSDLGDNAAYWIAESRYARDDFRGALAAFRDVAARFPEGNKVPDALLKAGQCLEAVGDRTAARESYGEVIRRFPGTVAATVADERQRALR